MARPRPACACWPPVWPGMPARSARRWRWPRRPSAAPRDRPRPRSWSASTGPPIGPPNGWRCSPESWPPPNRPAARETARALRFRIAFTAAEAGRAQEGARRPAPTARADATAAPCSGPGRSPAVPARPPWKRRSWPNRRWRRSSPTPATESRSLRLLALAEARERAGNAAGAAEPYRTAIETAPTGPLALEAALGLLRVLPSDAGEPALAQAFVRLAAAAGNTSIAGELTRESELLSLALGGRDNTAAGSADGPLEAIRLWVRGVHGNDPRAGPGGAGADGARQVRARGGGGALGGAGGTPAAGRATASPPGARWPAPPRGRPRRWSSWRPAIWPATCRFLVASPTPAGRAPSG